MFYDLALIFDQSTRRCDLALDADCNLAIDTTPITPMLLSIGLDHRASPDDPLPDGRSQFLAPASYSERRGCAGDALDPFGDLSGSLMWLLSRAKQTEQTRQLCAYWLAQCLAWALDETGEAAEIDVVWLQTGATGILKYTAE